MSDIEQAIGKKRRELINENVGLHIELRGKDAELRRLLAENAEQRETINLYEAMEEEVEIRITDLESAIAQALAEIRLVTVKANISSDADKINKAIRILTNAKS